MWAVHQLCFNTIQLIASYAVWILAMAVLDSWLADYLAIRRLAQSCQGKDTAAISDSPFPVLPRELTCCPFLPNLSGTTHSSTATIAVGIPSPPTHIPAEATRMLCPLGRQASTASSAPRSWRASESVSPGSPHCVLHP